MVDITTYIGKIKLENPTILASGILGETKGSMERVLASGAAAVTTKSIGLEPKVGHDNPTIVELEHGLLNAMGLPNPGVAEYIKELGDLVTSEKPIIASIFGKDENEFIKVASAMDSAGLPALELNLSCPHASGYGSELGSDPNMVKSITKAVKDAVTIPVYVKLTPNTADIVALGTAAVEGGCDALVAINTLKGMAISPELGRAVLSNKFGGYSGPGMKPVGLRCVYALANAGLEIPIIGVGGVTTGKDIVEYMIAGASAVQIGTAVYYHGINVFRNIVKEYNTFLGVQNYNSAQEIIGLALRN